jgi:hypothetical protein
MDKKNCDKVNREIMGILLTWRAIKRSLKLEEGQEKNMRLMLLRKKLFFSMKDLNLSTKEKISRHIEKSPLAVLYYNCCINKISEIDLKRLTALKRWHE